MKVKKATIIVGCLLLALGGCNEQSDDSSRNELSSMQTSIATQSQAESISNSINSDAVSNAESEAAVVKENKTPWLEDYDTFWEIVEENYALYAVAERITGNDFETVKATYRLQAAEAASAEELCKIIESCAQQFDETGHFWVATDKDGYQALSTLYGRVAADDAKCAYIYDRLNTPASIAFYGFDPSKEVETILENDGNATGTQSNRNLKFQDFPTDKTAYVSIAAMTSDFENNDGKVLEDWFRTLEAKGYQDCIFDIRENDGGSSSYWERYIVVPNLKNACGVSNYSLIKGEDCVDYWKTAGRELNPIDTLPLKTLPALQPADLEGVTHYINYAKRFEPIGEPLFSGRFWLLTSEKVYSSSEMFAAFCKDTKFATLVGTATGGDGIGEDPLTFSLPNSGICFRFSANEGLNADGSCNEEYGTQPDVVIKQGKDALEVCLETIRTTNESF